MKKKSLKSKYFFGAKNSDHVSVSGLGYREFMLLLEWDNEVKSYFQPEMEIILKDVNKSLKIDFWVERSSGITELVHLYCNEALDGDLLRGGHEHAEKLHCVFKPARIHDFINCRRLKNIEALWDYDGDVGMIYLSLLETFMKTGLPKRLLELKRIFQFNGLDPNIVYTLIFHRTIEIDINCPVTDETEFSVSSSFICQPLDSQQPIQKSFLEDF